MPSLSDLEKFKASFKPLGLELQTLKDLDLPFDDLPLPDKEPESAPPSAAESEDMGEGPAEALGEPYSPPPDGEPSGEMDLFGDLGDLLGGEAADLPVDEASAPAETDLGDLGTPDSGAADLGISGDDLGISGDDLGLPDQGQEDQDTGLPEFNLDDLGLPADETAADGSGEAAFDETDKEGIEDFPDLNSGESMEMFGEEAPISEGAPDDSGSTETDESAPDLSSLDLGNFDDFGGGESQEPFGEEQPVSEDASGDVQSELQAEETGGMDLSGLDLGDMPDFGGSESPVSAADGEPDSLDAAGTESDEDGFDFGGELPDAGAEAALEEIPEDGFDKFSPETGSLGDGFDVGPGDEFGSLEDFGIPGLDASFEALVPDKGKKAPKRNANDIEEISLTLEELEQFQETLSSYPLNLRIACEELIAEKAVVPEQMSQLIRMLVEGAPAEETAVLASKILDKPITIPKGYEKKTGEELEAEHSSFAYIFVHNFLPVFRLFMAIALVALSAGYLCWRYIYMPIKAERIYKLGIERIDAGEYSRANERFVEAYKIHPKKPWFYTYARAFRDARQYTLAEEKYKELLNFTAAKNKRGIPEKAAVLEYADLETNYIGDYQTADSIIRRNILDYFPADKDGLLALGDNSLIWGEYDKDRLEDAREAYAKLIERYGRTDPLLERMLKYFIRTDNLGQVLALQNYFMFSEKRIISAATLAEMGGYLLDKRLEKVRGVPNEYLDQIGGIRQILLRAIKQNPMLPESYYHLARYYNYYENPTDERLTLEVAVRVFEAAREESPKRIGYHINTLRRYAEVLINSKEFFPAEENLIKGINVYQNGLSRRLLTRSPEYGRLYADLGDLEFFVKDGDMQTALDYYNYSEQNGWAPPEMQYRMGAAHYQLRQWGPALERFFAASRDMPLNRRILYALGNVSYMRGNYFAAQGYYDRLLEILEDDKSRLPPITPTNDEDQLDIVERLMVAQNNMGVVLEALTERTGNISYRSRAQGLYSDSERAWDILTRNPTTMIRMRPSPDINAPGVNPAYLNVQNSLHPIPGYEHQFFLRIDKDVLEPSAWEELAPPGFHLSEGIHTGR